MDGFDSISRRQAIGLAGSVATAVTAGCLTDESDETTTTNSTDSGQSESQQSETEEDDAPSSNDDGMDWEDVDEIVLSATTSSFTGVEPEMIDGDTNPTLVLTEGREYVLTWKNADGQTHNLELWDESESVVGEHETELMAEEGESQSLEFEAHPEIDEYVCGVHADWGKRGSIDIEPAD